MIELLAVIAILALLGGITLGAAQGAKQRAANLRTRAELAYLAQALEEFRHAYGDYPESGDGGGVETGQGDARLFEALTGGYVPNRRAGETVPGPSFIERAKLVLDSERNGSASAGPDAFVDPWGNRYRYAYVRSRTAFSHDRAAMQPGFQLLSAGPDGATSHFSAVPGSPHSIDADDIIFGAAP